jgi:uncharacterized membrane protein
VTVVRARTVAVGLAAVAYVLASQWLMTRAPASPWSALVIVGPMLGVLAVYGWQHRQRTLGGAAALGLAALLWLGWSGAGLSPAPLYAMQHVAIHAALAVAFALTLRAGHEPLITALARRVHGRLTPDMESYSRKVTVAWAIYFVAMALLSIALFVFAPFEVWATFANFGTPVSMALLFFGEHVLRYRLHPEFERASLVAAMRAFSRRDVLPIEPRP